MEKELLNGLTNEQIEKVKACKNAEEILALAKEEGVELNDEQLEAISGGCNKGHGALLYTGWECPKCGSRNTEIYEDTWFHGATTKCFDCGYDSLKD